MFEFTLFDLNKRKRKEIRITSYKNSLADNQKKYLLSVIKEIPNRQKNRTKRTHLYSHVTDTNTDTLKEVCVGVVC